MGLSIDVGPKQFVGGPKTPLQTMGVQPGMSKLPKITNLQYLWNISKENMKDEADFLPADKHQRFLQIDTIILDVYGQACLNYSK